VSDNDKSAQNIITVLLQSICLNLLLVKSPLQGTNSNFLGCNQMFWIWVISFNFLIYSISFGEKQLFLNLPKSSLSQKSRTRGIVDDSRVTGIICPAIKFTIIILYGWDTSSFRNWIASLIQQWGIC
jgi:hypothetical protein